MEFKAFEKIPRLSREMIITEKIDGTNGLIFVGEFDQEPFLVGSRSRWITPGKSSDNAGFAAWAYEHRDELIAGLGPGFHYGEWWGKGIQRGYGLEEKKFSLFNVGRWSDPAVRPACCDVVPALYQGEFSTKTAEDYITVLKEHGSFAAPGFMNPEGIIIFHVPSYHLFKKTIEKDEEPKGLVKDGE